MVYRSHAGAVEGVLGEGKSEKRIKLGPQLTIHPSLPTTYFDWV